MNISHILSDHNRETRGYIMFMCYLFIRPIERGCKTQLSILGAPYAMRFTYDCSIARTAYVHVTSHHTSRIMTIFKARPINWPEKKEGCFTAGTSCRILVKETMGTLAFRYHMSDIL